MVNGRSSSLHQLESAQGDLVIFLVVKGGGKAFTAFPIKLWLYPIAGKGVCYTNVSQQGALGHRLCRCQSCTSAKCMVFAFQPGFSSHSCPNPLTKVQKQVPTCMHSTLVILHRTRRGCSCSKARNEVPHTGSYCPAWTNPTCFQFGKAELVAGARSSQDTPAAAWDRAHFSSCSSHSSTGPWQGSASPCAGGVCGYLLIPSLQQHSWRWKITPGITQPCSQCSSCTGEV